MKFSFLFLVLATVLFRVGGVNAQYVTIPDSNFVALLQDYFPNCMNGNQLDTTCPEVLNTTYLWCNNSSLYDLTGVQYFDSLYYLNCGQNQLTTLPSVPNSLGTLICVSNQLTSLPNLPSSLTKLWCWDNQLTNLPSLPNSLTNLTCNSNDLTSLPELPISLTDLGCSNNQLTSLPELPSSLNSLVCDINQLSSLPDLPNSLTWLICDSNQLTSLPDLPDTLSIFFVADNNNLLCMPALLNFSGPAAYFSIANTGITCLPNSIQHNGYIPAIDTVPVCEFINPNNCQIGWNILGNVFLDDNSDCSFNSNENAMQNIKLQLFQNGNIYDQVFTSGLGQYSFITDSQTQYVLSIDTTELPFAVICPAGIIQNLDLSTNPLVDSLNFGLICDGYDIGVQNIIHESGQFFPGMQAKVKIFAGDMMQYYSGVSCNTSGLSGTIKATFTGPVSIASLSLNGYVINDTITWNVGDFSLADFFSDYWIEFLTDTSGQFGDQVCVAVIVSPFNDNDSTNNMLKLCFEAVNSYDPNFKEVYPTIPEPSTWYTYTVHFQNTGTAAAQHIVVKDTLDSNLDWSSFQLLAYSHENLTQVKDNVVLFNFPNINLPDSNSNEPESHGYIQYKIKTNSNVNPITTTIHNTASIYFDFNDPIMTNDALIAPATGIENISRINFTLTPNPANDNITITLSQANSNDFVEIADITGRIVLQKRLGSNQTQINISELVAGTYFAQLIENDKRVGTKKLVVIR